MITNSVKKTSLYALMDIRLFSRPRLSRYM
nr:MAG TPA: hypothetical protein [Caudoviricetes sp.]